MLQIYNQCRRLKCTFASRKDFFRSIDLWTCMAMELSLGSNFLKQITNPAGTGVGVTDETLHFTEERWVRFSRAAMYTVEQPAIGFSTHRFALFH
jgi:hypothetical protein